MNVLFELQGTRGTVDMRLQQDTRAHEVQGTKRVEEETETSTYQLRVEFVQRVDVSRVNHGGVELGNPARCLIRRGCVTLSRSDLN